MTSRRSYSSYQSLFAMHLLLLSLSTLMFFYITTYFWEAVIADKLSIVVFKLRGNRISISDYYRRTYLADTFVPFI